MVIYRRVLIVFTLMCAFALNVYGQNQQRVVIDTSYQKYIEQINKKIRHHESADSLRKIYSEKFYQYWKKHPDTKTGRMALTTAFYYWGNTGDAESMDKAMEEIDPASKIWEAIMVPISNGYYRSDEKSKDDVVSLFRHLADTLSHLKSKSSALFALARRYREYAQKDSLIQVARKMVDLNASDYYVEKGLGFVYEHDSLSVGKKAPDFRARTVSGDSIALSDYRGKITVLEFWGTWCGPCLPEIPHLKAIYEKHPTNKLQIIGIALNRDTAKFKNFLREKEMDWPQIMQPQSFNDEIPELYNAWIIPRNYIIGRSGNIVSKDLRGKELEKEISKLVNKE